LFANNEEPGAWIGLFLNGAIVVTSRERVDMALNFECPDRAPRDLWALPGPQVDQKDEIAALIDRFPMDIGKPQTSPGTNRGVLEEPIVVGTSVDEWGSVWERAERGVIGEVKQPAIDDWAKLSGYRPPWQLVRDRSFDEVNRDCEQSDQFMLSAVTARPFERMQFLRGSEALFMDIAENSAEFRSLLAMVHDFYCEDVRGWCETHVDGVFLMDDWGAQQSLLIAPEIWRAVFKPLYREYCEMIHAAGKRVFFHSDGFTEAILGDLIEVGVDALNAQIFTMDIESLAQEYKGKITFWGEIDRQHILPFGSPDDVSEAVKRVRRALDDGTGGVIAQCEWGIYNPPGNIETVFQTWLDSIDEEPV